MIYKKEIIEEFTLFEDSGLEFIHIFKNGIHESCKVKIEDKEINEFSINIPEYNHLQLMLKQNIDIKYT